MHRRGTGNRDDRGTDLDSRHWEGAECHLSGFPKFRILSKILAKHHDEVSPNIKVSVEKGALNP